MYILDRQLRKRKLKVINSQDKQLHYDKVIKKTKVENKKEFYQPSGIRKHSRKYVESKEIPKKLKPKKERE